MQAAVRAIFYQFRPQCHLLQRDNTSRSSATKRRQIWRVEGSWKFKRPHKGHSAITPHRMVTDKQPQKRVSMETPELSTEVSRVVHVCVNLFLLKAANGVPQCATCPRRKLHVKTQPVAKSGHFTRDGGTVPSLARCHDLRTEAARPSVTQTLVRNSSSFFTTVFNSDFPSFCWTS